MTETTGIPNWGFREIRRYETNTKTIKPKYFIIQTYRNINSPNQVRQIYLKAIDIFINAGYEKIFQIYYNNKW